ncbi:MAG: metal dependent phosphohydrolase [Fibrobacteres bacterium]|nr:metal dependent phosphohydrolase [Fibrobacterota bacterium]
MAPPIPENADRGRKAGFPVVLIHNFTTLEFPETLPSGIRLESRKSLSLKDIYPFSILVIEPGSLEPGEDYDFLFQHVGVMLWDPSETIGSTLPPWVDIRLSRKPTASELYLACGHMLRLLELKEQCLKLHNANAITETRNRQLNQVGIALMSEKNLDQLLNMILEKAMELTGSDAGCLYLVEPKDDAEEVAGDYWANKRIRFKLTRNGSVVFNFAEMTMNPSKSSITGFTMLEGKPLNIPDVYAIPESAEFRHNHGFDQTSGYRTRSMLTLPMKDHRNQVVGAIQLINKCRNKTKPITSLKEADDQVTAYKQEDLNLSLSLASQASVALLNAQYERDIQNLFEGFINASVTAIESRDPTTSGHSNRVAEYCVRLSECVGRMQTGKYREVRLNDIQVREMRYAALLHDFGKIGVRENILTKAKKLFPEEMESIRLRSDFIKRTINWESEKAKVEMLRSGREADPETALRRLEEEERKQLESVESFYEVIRKANEPMRLDEATMEYLKGLGRRTYPDIAGAATGFLKPEELSRLMIPSGTLSNSERDEINSHVSHTWKFLSQIPWTHDLRQVPHIAFAHHEKLDGSGYPRKLVGDAIPLSAQIMTVCDIYDALAATDRPYKKSMPAEKALDIINFEVKAGKIDPELFQIFVDGRVYEVKT